MGNSFSGIVRSLITTGYDQDVHRSDHPRDDRERREPRVVLCGYSSLCTSLVDDLEARDQPTVSSSETITLVSTTVRATPLSETRQDRERFPLALEFGRTRG
ncbi:hypothetical protein [Natrinema sp. SYSU A 869]|uniref:hypothetical protein n=1 Tax=Natrinema sp. SYSU A 869 TaxID=2871694 RepID=UPI001CA38BD5|nr:hypothetical protein [Natrinema sp. SYSU A 869]